MKDSAKIKPLQDILENINKPKPVAHKVILLRESLWQSIASDLITFCAVIGIIGVGSLLKSEAMQWAGFILTTIYIITLASNKNRRLTISEARTRLDEIEKDNRKK